MKASLVPVQQQENAAVPRLSREEIRLWGAVERENTATENDLKYRRELHVFLVADQRCAAIGENGDAAMADKIGTARMIRRAVSITIDPHRHRGCKVGRRTGQVASWKQLLLYMTVLCSRTMFPSVGVRSDDGRQHERQRHQNCEEPPQPPMSPHGAHVWSPMHIISDHMLGIRAKIKADARAIPQPAGTSCTASDFAVGPK